MDLKIQIFRLFLASLVGVLMGLERVVRQKNAGVGTFSIICITSCFLTLISVYGFGSEGSDPGRLASNIITAIGFVSGGVIFTVGRGNDVKVTGLTTGAEIFCVSSIGMGLGLGMYIPSLVAIILMELNILLANYVKSYYKKVHLNNSYDKKGKDSLKESEVDI